MKPAQLNFLKPTSAYSWLSLALLAIGISVLTAVYWQYQKDNAQFNSLQEQLEKLSHKKPVKHTKNNAIQTDGFKRQLALQTQIQQSLVTPWNILLQALEETKTDSIQLIEINPNATAHTLSITGQAPQLEDVLAYVKALSQQSVLGNVDLIDHQVIKTDANTMVKFEIEAIWNQP